MPPFQPVFWPWLQPGGVPTPRELPRRPGLLIAGGIAAIRGPPARRAPGGLGGGTGGAGGRTLDPPPGPPPPGPPRENAGVVIVNAAAIVAAIATVAKLGRIVMTCPAVVPKRQSRTEPV